MLTRELKAELNKIFVQNKEYKNLYITVLSFGFKYGIPNDADLVFDVRFLPNPYYIEELRPMSGNDQPVRDYVMNNDTAKTVLDKAYGYGRISHTELHFRGKDTACDRNWMYGRKASFRYTGK